MHGADWVAPSVRVPMPYAGLYLLYRSRLRSSKVLLYEAQTGGEFGTSDFVAGISSGTPRTLPHLSHTFRHLSRLLRDFVFLHLTPRIPRPDNAGVETLPFSSRTSITLPSIALHSSHAPNKSRCCALRSARASYLTTTAVLLSTQHGASKARRPGRPCASATL
jgi:hypothetical protein